MAKEKKNAENTEFRQRIKQTLKRYPYLAAIDGHGKIVGYAYASSFKDRAAYDWSVETTIYVDKDAKRQGIGKKLYKALEEILQKQHVINLDKIACVVDFICESGNDTTADEERKEWLYRGFA